MSNTALIAPNTINGVTLDSKGMDFWRHVRRSLRGQEGGPETAETQRPPANEENLILSGAQRWDNEQMLLLLRTCDLEEQMEQVQITRGLLINKVIRTSSITSVPPACLEMLTQQFKLLTRSNTIDHLAANPFLLPLLNDVAAVLRDYFPHCERLLRVIRDADDGHPELVVFVRTKEAPEIALERLWRFDDEWWLANSGRANGQLTICLEYE